MQIAIPILLAQITKAAGRIIPPNRSRFHRGDSRVGSIDWLGGILKGNNLPVSYREIGIG